MVLDAGGVFLDVGLAIVGFAIVALVCIVVLRLIGAVLPPGDGEDQ